MIIDTDFILPGINRLLRMHWAVRKKLQAELVQHIQDNYDCQPIEGPVVVEYTRRSIRLMDWDNACGSFKLLGDALVQCGILEDDNPSIIEEFKPDQQKVSKRAEQGFRLVIRRAHVVP
jgi:hypothetical protein|tara:strand:- start:622 stop:978 length:357 start_codon:yes stop_codon:yes gene_type:complete